MWHSRFNATSKFGRMIDPLVDKVLVVGTFICFALIGEPKLFNLSAGTLAVIHWFVVAVLASREIYVTVLRQIAEAKGIDFRATASGKFKMLLQSFAIGTVLIKMATRSDAGLGLLVHLGNVCRHDRNDHCLRLPGDETPKLETSQR